MPRFRIQSNLHLDGFQMLDACLENVTSFEGLDDKNDGRIVFLNGSSGNQSNLHPAVCYGSVFKGLAYLDDIDKITNGEGSLGTRVKALEDMLGLQDVTDVIDTWNDVQEFFKNVNEGLNLMTMLDGKLDTKGGVIKGDSWLPLQIVSDHASSVAITLSPSSGNGLQLGWSSAQGAFLLNYKSNCQIGVHPDGYPYFKTYTDWYTLIHEGNFESLIGDTYLKTDGSKIMTAPIRFSAASVDYDAAADGLALLYTSSANNAPNNGDYGRTLSVVNGSAGFQLGISPAYPTLYYRAKNTNWGDWKTIAFTDSTVAAAYKLKNPSTNADVVTITEEGNVNVGSSYIPATLPTPKMSIGGLLCVQTVGGALSLSSLPEKGLVLGGNGHTLSQYLENSGNFAIQAHYISDGTVRALNLNPLGGAVNVGSGGLKVDGNSVFSGKVGIGVPDPQYKLDVNGGEMRVQNNIYVTNASLFRSFLANGTAHSLVGINSSDQVLINAGNDVPTIIRGGNVGIGVYNPQYKLDVAGIGNFSSRVLIGGVEDDGESDLRVLKTIAVGTSKQVYGAFLTRSNLQFFIPENHPYSHSVAYCLNVGSSTFASFGFFYDSNTTKRKAYIGKSHTDTWFTINSTESFFNVATTFNRGALIPTGQKLTIGDANGDHATIEYDSIAKAIKVDGNLFTTGTNASGGKADDQSGNTGGGSAEVYKYDLDWGEQVYEIQNVKGDVNVNVQVYEWNGNGNSWDMILTDVSVTADIITVTFGRPTSVDHMVTVV